MPARKLSDLCLENITLNLYTNYRICKKYSYKIPEKLQIEIFENSFNNLWKFDYYDLKLFNKNIFQLKFIDLREKKFEKIENFDFLNGQNLDYLHIDIIENFKLVNNKDFTITVKDLYINISSYYFKTYLNMFKTLLYNCNVTQSITFLRHTGRLPIDFFCVLLINSRPCVKKFDLKNISLTNEEFMELMKILKYRQNLEELHLNLSNIDSKKNFEHWFNFVPNNVSSLHLIIRENQMHIFRCLPNFIKNLKQLKEFSLDKMSNDLTINLKILKTLRKHHKSTLKTIKIKFPKRLNEIEQYRSVLFDQCDHLEFCDFDFDTFNYKLLRSSKYLRCKFNAFSIPSLPQFNSFDTFTGKAVSIFILFFFFKYIITLF